MIEIACGLITEKQQRVSDQGAGKCHALSFSAGKLSRPMIQAIQKSHLFQQGSGPLDGLIIRPGHQRRNQNILEDGALRQETMLLEDKSNGFIPEDCQFFFVQLKRVLAIQSDAPGGGRFESSQDIQQSAFAAA